MAIEKILSTRILNKIDTLENWNASTLPIKKGEICLATVAASAGTGLTEPVIMIKIGEDGVKTFKDLPWNLYAKASDVLAACKTEAGLTEFINNVIAGAGIATDEALATLAGRVTTVENDLNTATTGLKARMTAVETLVGDTSVATQIQNKIDALKLADTYAAKVHTHTKADITDFAHTHAISEVTDLQNQLDAAKKAGTDADAHLEAYKVTNDKAVKDNADAIAAINNVDTGILAQAKTYADGKDASIAAAKAAADAAQADVNTLAGKVGTVTDGKTVVEMIEDAKKAATDDNTALATRVTTAENDIDALEAKVGDKTVSTQIEEKITALDLANTYEAKGAAAAVKTELVGKDIDTAASATIAGAKKYADGLNADMDTRVAALETAVGEDGSVAEKITAAVEALDATVETPAIAEGQDGIYVKVTEVDGKLTAVEATIEVSHEIDAAKAELEGKIGAVADGKTLAGLIADNAAAIEAHKTAIDAKVTTLIGADTDKSVRTIANEELAAQLIPEGAKESLDTLQEIAAWIQAHPDDASAMNAAIDKLEGLVGDGNVSERIAAAVKALEDGKVKTNADAIAVLEGKSHEHANKALLDTYTQTETDLADAVAKKHAHDNATVLDGISAEKVTAWDAAVQTVTAGTGLKATKTGTDVAVDFDDTVTFIFDCGDATP